MRCSEAIQTPSASNDSPALAAHLASCPACAGWAEDDAQVLRAWRATRPAEPSAEAWDAVWASVSAGLDSAERSRVFTMPERAVPRFRLGLAALGLAQAAAILIAVVLLPGRQPQPPDTLAQATPTVGKFDIDDGELTMLREQAGTWVKAPIVAALDDRSVDGNFALFNDVESMAETD